MTMAKTPHQRNARKQGQRLAAMARAKRILNLKKKNEPLIPAEVLRRLASLNLPPNPWVYDVCLRELMRDATCKKTGRDRAPFLYAARALAPEKAAQEFKFVAGA